MVRESRKSVLSARFNDERNIITISLVFDKPTIFIFYFSTISCCKFVLIDFVLWLDILLWNIFANQSDVFYWRFTAHHNFSRSTNHIAIIFSGRSAIHNIDILTNIAFNVFKDSMSHSVCKNGYFIVFLCSFVLTIIYFRWILFVYWRA